MPVLKKSNIPLLMLIITKNVKMFKFAEKKKGMIASKGEWASEGSKKHGVGK